jgi:hypothetical protein
MLPIGAAVSIPVTWVSRFLMHRRENRFASRMRACGKLVSWSEARAQVEQGCGFFVEETLSAKGPYRLWWTPIDIPSESPHSCCFERFPECGESVNPESPAFHKWCRSRLTDPDCGAAQLVDLADVDRKGVNQILSELHMAHRCVSVCFIDDIGRV